MPDASAEALGTVGTAVADGDDEDGAGVEGTLEDDWEVCARGLLKIGAPEEEDEGVALLLNDKGSCWVSRMTRGPEDCRT